MPDRELLENWAINGISDPAELVVKDWRKQGMIVTAPSGRRAYVRRHGRYEWSLSILPYLPRNRWGNLKQIREDLAYFLQCGQLPAPVGGPW